ncbi:MAG: dephospho-CoA kinase [Thermoprotei archaeon]|mgnify:FL=1|nr:MAG: dephospho-CoA kinase [Thermoprotei archaeon]
MKRRKKLILVAGLPGSGKSVFSKVAEKNSIPVVSLGDVVREEARKRGLDLSAENLGKIATELRQRYGKDIMARRVITKLLYSESPIIVVDGVRSLDEVEYFKKFFDVVIVAIHTSPKTRFSRLRARGRPDDPRSWSDFRERDERELSLGIGNVIALADFMIVNEEISLSEFEALCERLITKIAGEYFGENRS